MYNVRAQCTMYNVQCNVQVQCTMYNVQCTMYNVQCTMYNVQCTMYNVHCVRTPRCARRRALFRATKDGVTHSDYFCARRNVGHLEFTKHHRLYTASRAQGDFTTQISKNEASCIVYCEQGSP